MDALLQPNRETDLSLNHVKRASVFKKIQHWWTNSSPRLLSWVRRLNALPVTEAGVSLPLHPHTDPRIFLRDPQSVLSSKCTYTAKCTGLNRRVEHVNELTVMLSVKSNILTLFLYLLININPGGTNLRIHMCILCSTTQKEVVQLLEKAWLICFSCSYITLNVPVFYFGLGHRLCTSVASELAAFLTFVLHTGWCCGLIFVSLTLITFQIDPIPSVQIPLNHRLPLQAFNTQLLCLLVLQFSPSPSPLQVLFICPVSSPHLNADSSTARS